MVTRQTVWDNVTIAKVTKWLADGVPYSQMALDLGLTRSAVAGRVKRHGLVGVTPNTQNWKARGRTRRRQATPDKGARDDAHATAPTPAKTPRRRNAGADNVVADTSIDHNEVPAVIVNGDAPLHQCDDAANEATPVCTASIAVDTIGLNDCRWPIGDPAGEFRFCRDVKEVSSSYCKYHRGLAYAPQARKAWVEPKRSRLW